jgi:hypothetical protein
MSSDKRPVRQDFNGVAGRQLELQPQHTALAGSIAFAVTILVAFPANLCLSRDVASYVSTEHLSR